MSYLCQAEDGIRDLVRSRGLGDVYKRQQQGFQQGRQEGESLGLRQGLLSGIRLALKLKFGPVSYTHLTLPTSDLV